MFKVARVFLMYILFSFSWAAHSNTNGLKVVRVGGYEFAPFVKKDGKEGIVKDLIEKMNSSQDQYQFKFVSTSANRRYRDFKARKFDVILFEDIKWGWDKSGLSLSTTAPFGKLEDLAVALKEDNRDDEYLKSLEDKRVHVVLGFHYPVADMETEVHHLAKKGLKYGKSDDENFKDLLKKNVDVIFVNSHFLNTQFKQMPEIKNQILVGRKWTTEYSLRAILHPEASITAEELEKNVIRHKSLLDVLN